MDFDGGAAVGAGLIGGAVMDGLQAYVGDSGEGRWTVEESIELAVALPVITASLQARFRSRQDQPFGVKLLASMRNQFGGHAVRPVVGGSCRGRVMAEGATTTVTAASRAT